MTGAAAGGGGRDAAGARPTQRLDKWLWFARFLKTRAMAAALVSDGRVRLNGEPCAKPARAVGPGDTLTFPQGRCVRVVRVLAVGARRGPAPEAQALYEDLTPTTAPAEGGPRPEPGGRPTGRDRRAMDRARGRDDAES